MSVYISGTGLFTPKESITNEELVNSFNSYSVGELTTQYLRALKENAFIENNSAGVGLIDIRRYNHSKIDFKIKKDGI